MRFFCQTLLFVCLILPCAVFGQPVANDDSASTPEDTDAVFNIVANDTDPTFAIDPATVDLDISSPLSIENTFTTPQGEFNVDPLGEVTFIPTLNFWGSATLSYTVKNNEATPQTSAPALISITVTAVNDEPTITSIADLIINEDTQTGLLGFTVDDVETPGGSLTVTAASNNLALVPLANISLVQNGADWTVQVTPVANQSGIALITLTVGDGTDTEQTDFQLTVIDPPTITGIADQTILESTQTGLLAFTVGDEGTPPASLTVTSTSDNPVLIPDGNIVISGGGANRTVQVTPDVKQNGDANITLTVDDGGETAETTFRVTVTAVNEVPVFTKGADQVVNEDVVAQVINNWATAIDDGDVEAQVLTFTVTALNTALFSVQPAVNASGQLTYTPAANANGATVVNVTLSDNGPAAPPPNANTSPQQSFNITINALNDAPTFTKGSDQTITENSGAQTINNWAAGISDGDPELTQALTFNVSNDNNALFSVQPSISPSGDLTYTSANDASGLATVNVTLSDNGAGPGVNTSAPQTFTINVVSINDPPVFTKGPDQSINEDAGLQTVAGWATGIDDGNTEVQVLTFNVTAVNTALFTVQPAIGATGTLTYTPAANANGTTVVNATLSDDGLSTPPPNDNTSAQQTFNITINAINDAPVFTKGVDQTIIENAGAQTINNWATAIGDGDPELTQAVTFNVTNDNNALFSVQPSISPVGNLTYTPATNSSGSATVSVTLSDDGAGPGVNTSPPQTFVIDVTPINNVPVFTKGADQAIGEDGGAQTVPGWATGISDGDNDEVQVLTFAVTALNTALFSVQPAVSASGQLTYTPAPNANGATVVNVTLSDNGPGAPPPNINTSAQQTFNIAINALNDAPVFTKGADQTVTESAGAQTINNWATAISDGDPELTQALTFNVSNDNNALFSVQPAVSPSGDLTYTPAVSASGSATVSVTLSDDGAGPGVNVSAPQTFTITVTPLNSAPVFTKGGDQTIGEDAGAQTVAAWATGIDDGDTDEVQTLTFAVTALNTALFTVQPAVNPSGQLTYTPAPNANGTTVVNVTLSDNGPGAPPPNVNTSAQQTFNITIDAVNDAPVFVKGADQTVPENSGAQTINNWATAISDGDPELTQSVTFNASNNNNALFSVQPSISPAGNLIYTPANNMSGSATVTVTLSDDGAGPGVNISAPQTFTISITPINSAPVFTKGADQTTGEDGGAQTVAGWATGIDDGDTDEVQTLTFTVTALNTALFSVQPAVNASGQLTYTPAPNANGATVVNITLSDNGPGAPPPNVNTSAQQTFNITINAINDVPLFAKGPDQTISDPVGQQTVAGWATGISDGDPEVTQALTFNVTNDNNALFSAQPAISPAGDLTYTPVGGASGLATVNVTLSDDGAGPGVNTSAPQSFTINISSANNAPVFVKGADQTIGEDGGAQTVAAWATGIDDGDTDEVQALTFSVTALNTALFSVQPAISASGQLTYTTAPNANGATVVNVTLSDDGPGAPPPNVNTSAQQTFNITINAINDAPVFVKGADQTVAENAGAQTINNWATAIGDGDPELTQALTFNVSNDNNALFSVQPAISPAGDLTYTPAVSASGLATVNVTLSDNGVGPGVNTSAAQTFTINVSSANSAPVFVKGADQTIGEDGGAQTVAAWATGIDDGDTDEVQALTFSVTALNTALFSVQPAISPSGQLTYTTAPNANGATVVNVTLSDDGPGAPPPNVNTSAQQTFNITINAINDAPVFVKGGDQTVAENAGAQTINNWATAIGDGDPELTQALTFNVSNDNNALFSVQPAITPSGNLTYTPANNSSGSATVNVTLSDDGAGPGMNTSAAQSFTINVSSTNNAPVFVKGPDQTVGEDGGAQTIAAWATGIDDGDSDEVQTLTFSVTALNTALFSVQPAVNASGQLTYTTAPNANGATVVNVTLNDDGPGAPPPNVNTSAQQTFNITINAINDAPVFAKGPDQTVNENAGAQTINNWATAIGDGDPELTQVLTFNVSNNNNALFSVQPAISPSGTLTFTGANNANGTATVNVTLTDDGVGPGVNTSAVQTFTINVNANNPPTITSIADQTINENTQTGPLSFTIGDVETPATSLTLTPVSSNTGLVPNANVVFGGSGSLRNVNVTPTINGNGITTITLTVSDGAKTAQTAFQVTVTAVDDPPTITSIADQIIDEDTQTGLLTFTIGDVDTGPGSLTVTGVSDNVALVPDANIALAGIGGADWTVQVTPLLNQWGEANITLTVSDGTETADIAFKVTVTAVNDVPTISVVADQSIVEDTPTSALVFTIGDVETAPGSLTVTRISSDIGVIPLAGVVLGGSGASRTVTVTPGLNQVGSSIITLTVSDGTYTADEVFTVTVTAADDPPLISAIGDQTINEDAVLGTGALSFTVGDPDTPVGSLTVTAASSDLTLVPLANIGFGGSGASRTVTVIPAANQNGASTITLTVSDGTLTAVTDFIVNVTPVNDAPTITAIADQVIDEDTPGGTGLLTFNVADLETAAASLTVTRVSSNLPLVPLANVVLGGSGANRNVRVTPLLNQSGSTTITLTVSDGTMTSQIDFLVTVNAVNDDPTITAIANQTIDENTPTGPLSFTIGDVETAPASLTLTTSSSNTTLVPLANVVLGGSGASRNVNVTPALNENGVTTITITVNDGTSTAQITFQVSVNSFDDAPTISAIADLAVNEDTPTGSLVFTIGDTETAAGSLTLAGSSSNTTLVPNTNIVFGGSGASRSVVVTPAPNQYGVSIITVNVSDGVNTTPETFQLTVNAVNDAPTITAIADQVIPEDNPGGTGPLTFTVGDAETPGSLTVTSISSNVALVPLANVVLGGSGADRTVTVNPLPNLSGSTTITLTVSDGLLTAPISFLVTVNAVNDLPTITAIADQTVDENEPTGPLAFTIGDAETPGTLVVTTSSSNTTVVPLANVVLGGSGASRTVNVTPALNESGVTSITITVDDGTSMAQTTFQVSVNSVDGPPTITAIADQVTNEGIPTGALSFTIGDSETAAGSLTLSGSSSNTSLVPNANISFGGSGASRTVTVTPAAFQSGVATITVNVSDGVNTTPETFVLTVNAVNDAPTISAIGDQTINEDTPTGDLVFTIGDAETAPSGLTVTASSDNATLVPNTNITLGGTGPSRTVNISPVANLSGVAIITVNVSDGVITVPRTFQVTVTASNDAPTITAVADQTVVEDTPTAALAFTIGDVETSVGTLTVNTSSSNTVLVPTANVVLGGSGASRTVTITPAANQTGVSSITLTVDDGTASTSTNFNVTVTGVDDPPTISAISDRTINEDSQTGAINFTIGDAETAPAALTVSGSSSDIALIPVANISTTGTGAARTVNVTPAPNMSGVAVITLNVSDGVNTTPTTFQVTVNPLNDAPLVTAQIAIVVDEEQPVVLSIPQLTIVDPDNVAADFSLIVTGGANYTITGPTTITPNPNYNGPLSVPVLVSDGNAFSPIFNVQITVNSTNNIPVISGQDPLTMNEDQTLAIQINNVTVNDPDDNFPADFTLTVLPGDATYTFSGNTITPALNFNGTLTVLVKVNDGAADSPPFNLQISVAAVNDPPAITAQSPLSTNEQAAITLVIGNFTVVDPEPTTYTLSVSQTPGTGYTVSGNTITPNPDYTTTLSVPVTVSDGTLNSAVYNAQIQVIPVNDPPTITGQISLATIEETPITLQLTDLTVVDVDNLNYPTGFTMSIQDGDNYTFSGTTVTPGADFSGTISVNVTVNDGTNSSVPFPVQIVVTDDADAPVITGQSPISMSEDTSRPIVLADIVWADPDTDPALITVSVLAGTNYAVSGNTITPIANFYGTLSVNVRVNDGEANSNTFPLQVTVVAANDPPTFNAIANITVLEDAPQQSFVITGLTPGPLETQALSLFIVSDNTALIPQPIQTPTYNGTAASATISFKPEPNVSGTATIEVKVIDGDPVPLSFTRTFTITVTPVNDAPTLAAIANIIIPEDSPEQIIPLNGITPGGGPDENAQTITVIASTDKPELFEIFETTPPPTASLRLKPKAEAFGTAQITIKVQDSGPNSPAPNVNFITRVFTLDITPMNDLPKFVSEPGKFAEPGVPYVYLVDVVDVDGDVITLTAPTMPGWLTFTPGTNGKATLSGTPPSGQTGDTNVLIEATDPTGPLVQQPYTITVNSRPILSPVTIQFDEDTNLEFTTKNFTDGFDDPDGNPLAELQITQLPNPEKGTLTFNNNPVAEGDKIPAAEISALKYAPALNATGTDTLFWNASDGYFFYALQPTYTVFNIKPSNDPPIITVLETDTLKYELGSEVPVLLTPAFDGYDPDGDLIAGAEIGFKRLDENAFREDNDRLIFNSTNPKITGEYTDAGILTLKGSATAAEYVEAIRTIRYNYVDATEILLDTRSIYIELSDGVLRSQQKNRIVTLIYTFSDLVIPNAFSPNIDDAVNQTWVIKSPNGTDQNIYTDAEVKVYNKRGLLLFETKGFEKSWNGIWNGELLPSDTYFYTIDLKYNRVRYKGTVTILR